MGTGTLRLVLFALLFLLTGCQAAHGWMTDDVVAVAEDLERLVSESAGEEFQEWQEAADADQDGQTTWAEWWSFLFGGSGGVALLWFVIKRLSERCRHGVAKRGAGCQPVTPCEDVAEPQQNVASAAWYEDADLGSFCEDLPAKRTARAITSIVHATPAGS